MCLERSSFLSYPVTAPANISFSELFTDSSQPIFSLTFWKIAFPNRTSGVTPARVRIPLHVHLLAVAPGASGLKPSGLPFPVLRWQPRLPGWCANDASRPHHPACFSHSVNFGSVPNAFPSRVCSPLEGRSPRNLTTQCRQFLKEG